MSRHRTPNPSRSAGIAQGTAILVAVVFASASLLMVTLMIVLWDVRPSEAETGVIGQSQQSQEGGGEANPAREGQGKSDQNRTQDTTPTPGNPTNVEPTATPEPSDAPDAPEAGEAGDLDADTTPPADTPEPSASAPRPNDRTHFASASRLPFPAVGETIDTPIAFARLDQPQNRPPQPAPADGQVVPWDQAAQYVGSTITTQGTIVATKRFNNFCLLNFDENWQGKFYLAIYSEAFDALPAPPEQYFLNKTVRVTGEVEYHKGDRTRPQIEIRDASRFTVVEPKS